MRQEEYIGPGAVYAVGPALDRLGAERVLLVTGRASFEACGAAQALQEALAGRVVHRFRQFGPNPKTEDVLLGMATFDECRPDTILAVGGGSVMDMAKLMNACGTNRVAPTTLLRDTGAAFRSRLPLIAVPTTAGSGSQATTFAVLYVNGRKHSVDHEYILPDVAAVDPELTMSVSCRQAAASGMDALAHAVESHWSTRSTDQSRRYSAAAIRLIATNLVRAAVDRSPAARRAMARAAHLAGKAINITRTTASHAISYPLTARFGVPHGHAVALTLPSLLAYNAAVTPVDVADERGCLHARRAVDEVVCLLGARDVPEACDRVRALTEALGLEPRLGPLGLAQSDNIELVVADALSSPRVANNPRALHEGALRRILQETA